MQFRKYNNFLMKIFESMDLFGEVFNFTILGKSTYTTKIGGILSLILILTSIGVSFMFGMDLINKSNPNVIFSRIIPENYTYINCTTINFPFYWRISDDDTASINFTGILYPNLILYVYKKNQTTNKYDSFKNISMPVKFCTKALVGNDLIFEKLGLQNYYCIDWTDSGTPLGGHWDGADIVYYFEKVFYRCPNDDTNSSKCTNVTFMKDWLGSSNKLFYEIYYPSVYFSPENYTHPLRIELINSIYQITTNLYKKTRFFFSASEIQSDKGVIFPSVTTEKKISMDSSQQDFEFKSDNDLMDSHISSSILATTIYLMRTYNKYSLSYMKLQDLAAQVGGIMKILMVIFLIINFPFKEFQKDIDVLNNIFEFNQSQNEINDNKLSKIELNNFLSKKKTLYDKSFKQNEEQNSKISKKSSFKLIDLIESNRPVVVVEEEKQENDLNKLKIAIKNTETRDIFKNNTKLEIEFVGFFKSICNCCKNQKDRESFDILEIGKKFIVDKLDLMYFLKIIEQLNGVKSLLLKPYQIFLLDNQKKINLYSKEERINLYIRDNQNLSSENEMQLLIILSIIDKIKEKSLETIDLNFYENLDPFIKKMMDDIVNGN